MPEANPEPSPRMFSPTDPLRDLLESVILEPLAFVGSVPELLAKGKAKIESQSKTANMIGKFVVPIAKRKIDAELKTVADSVRSYLTSTEPKKRGSGSLASPVPAGSDAAAPPPTTVATNKDPKTTNKDPKKPAAVSKAKAKAQPTTKSEPKSEPKAMAIPSAPRNKAALLPERPVLLPDAHRARSGAALNDLGLDRYDDLPASSVVGLLEALTPIQLGAIARYEESHRNRQTILAGVARLLASPSGA